MPKTLVGPRPETLEGPIPMVRPIPKTLAGPIPETLVGPMRETLVGLIPETLMGRYPKGSRGRCPKRSWGRYPKCLWRRALNYGGFCNTPTSLWHLGGALLARIFSAQKCGECRCPIHTTRRSREQLPTGELHDFEQLFPRRPDSGIQRPLLEAMLSTFLHRVGNMTHKASKYQQQSLAPTYTPYGGCYMLHVPHPQIFCSQQPPSAQAFLSFAMIAKNCASCALTPGII
jgi:hypothetical protein